MATSRLRRVPARWRWRSLLAGLACVAVLVYAVPGSPAAARVTAGKRLAGASSCPDVLFLGLRGDNDGAPNRGITMDGSGIGADVAALVSLEQRDFNGYPISMKAQGVPFGRDPSTYQDDGGDNYANYMFDDSGNPGLWVGGEIDNFVATVHNECPRTFLVIVAQSLGAMALHYATEAPKLAGAVVLFGDPLHVANDKTVDAGEDNSGNGFATGADTPGGLFDVPKNDRPPPYPNDVLDTSGNVRSYCLNNDGVCGSCTELGCWGSWTNWWTAWQGTHTQYRTGRDGLLYEAEYYVGTAIWNWWISQPTPTPVPSPTPPPPPHPTPPPPPPKSGLFLYDPSTGASYTEFPDGSGGWSGVKGPAFSAGWQVYPGQFTWDGRTDLFVYNPGNGANYVDLSDGAGGWTGIKGPSFSPGWQIYIGDFGSDGRTDLFAYNPSNGNNYTEFPNNGGGWYGIKGPYFSPGWQVYPGKFLGGHMTDLFVYNTSTGANYIEVPDGSGGWTGVKGPYFSPGWRVYTGDFNGDGKTDLFVYNQSNGANYVELANGSGGWTGVKGPYFSPGWSVYTGDFNGDGKTDLFVYNPSNGANYVELANGSGGWTGVKGPYFSPGWSVYPGIYR
jgi:FG-GAP-like repeat